MIRAAELPLAPDEPAPILWTDDFAALWHIVHW